MPYITPVRDTANDIITGLFEKKATEADIVRFSAQDPGKSVMYTYTEWNTLGGTLTLPYNYQVGNRQLNVNLVRPDGTTRILVEKQDWAAKGVPTPTKYFEEVSSNVVNVFGVDSLDYVECVIPHTATPGQFSSKVVIGSQNSGQAIDLEGPGDGIVFTSTNGSRYLVNMSDNGILGGGAV